MTANYGLYTVCVILLCVELIHLAPILKRALYWIGKHSMNIFLTHSILQSYLKPIIMAPKYFILDLLILLTLSFAVSVLLEKLKKAVRYDIIVKQLEIKVNRV